MGFLGNIFTTKQDGGSLVAIATGIAAILAQTPGGPELLGSMLAGTGKYAPLVLAAIAFFSGARAGQPVAK